MSVAFSALLQTLKSDPEPVNVIHNMPVTNDSEQHNDNNYNKVIKYLQVNKDKILDLVEKNYESLVEVLTNNAISSATTSNPTLSLSQSSSTFPILSNQHDTCRKERPVLFSL